MVFIACGLSHQTTPLAMREKIATPLHLQEPLYKSIQKLPFVQEVAILSTCNRTEFYCTLQHRASLLPWLSQTMGLSEEALSPHLYTYYEEEAVQHVLRVSTGLDSMVVGEPQIFGQLKQTLQHAYTLNAAGKTLRRIFSFLFRVSKEIRTESGIGKNPVSIAYAALQWIRKTVPHYHNASVLLIGSGEIASLTAKYLQKAGLGPFFIASRSEKNAALLAAPLQGIPLTIHDIPDYLVKADIIISATSCPLPFIDKAMVETALMHRKQAPLFFLDLAVPRDIAEEVASLAGVTLYNMDTLQQMVAQGIQERHLAAQKAEFLIKEAVTHFQETFRIEAAKDVICYYRDNMQLLAQQEVDRALQKLALGLDQKRVLQEFCDRFLHKCIHTPTQGLRQIAKEQREELFQLMHYLFHPHTSKNHEEIN